MKKRIDVHAHFIPDAYRSALIEAGHSKPSGMPAIPEWNVEEHLKVMDRNEISAAILSISAPGVHFGDDAAARKLARSVNDEAAKIVESHPTRFGFFATLPLPDVEGSLQEINYVFDNLNADGIVLESNYHGIYLGDKKFDPIFEELNLRHAKIFIHPTNPYCLCCQERSTEQSNKSLPPIGYPFPMIEFMFETTRAVFNLILSGTIKNTPDLSIIIPHAGATIPILADRVIGISPALGLSKPIDSESFFDSLSNMYYDLAGFPLPRQLKALLDIANPKRILYGSDYPFTPEPLVIKHAKLIDDSPQISKELWLDFMHKNAVSLFPKFADKQ